ncbi:hypothetical protein DW352_08045 [Pseudolabrys taiwanensis]|uniref:Uncharacterized protein n=1 Tax=Pseudolabrys taiwanensis TaxID=331696 RepID=A0A345ZU72_9HYPH|nr:hypothetical protein DW352_08045 [Pseudolabrys taiwanensis]
MLWPLTAAPGRTSTVTASRHTVHAKLRSSGWPNAAGTLRASRIGAPQRGHVGKGWASLMREKWLYSRVPASPD